MSSYYEKPAALPGQLDEPVVWLSAAQASVVAAHPGLAALGLTLPCWAPQRLVGRALGHGPGGVDAAVAHLGRSYAWATEFENVHSLWRYDEPPLTIGGRVYAGSEAYYHAQKPQPWDKALWDRRKRRVMETAVRAKLAADPGGLRELLLATGRHPLLSLKRDAVWGFDPVTARGENLLAEIWMQLRAELQQGSLAVADAADVGTARRPPREPIESKEPKLARCEVLLFACSRSPELAITMGSSFKQEWAEYIALHDLLLAGSTPFLMFDNSSWWDLHPSSHIDASPLTVDKIAEALRTHRPRVVHLGMHGDPAGFAMQWEAGGEKRCRVHLGASDIRERLDLRGVIVVSSACSTGSVGLGEAILAAGAIAYVAPREKIAISRLGGFMSELLPRCARALSATPADVRRCLEEALDAPSADGPTFREWYGSFFVFARDAPTLVIGISGCTRSGKSTLASWLAEALGASKTAVIQQDRFASKRLAAQAEGGWESTESIDFKAFRDAVVEASKSKHFVIVEGFRAFASRPPGGVVELLHHLVWIELSRETCYERRMATMRVSEECFDRHLWPRHDEYRESCFGKGGPIASGRNKLVLDGTKPPTLLLRQVLVALGLPAPAPAPPPPVRPVSAAAAWFDGSLKKLHEALAEVEPKRSVGVVTLLGSLCPVTRGHVQAFIEARRILLGEAGVARPARLEPFGAVVGLISLNGSSYVDQKLAQKGEASLSAEKRLALVKMAAEELPWLSWESCGEGETVELLRKTHPHLHFVHFFMNGADDVVRYRKYRVGPQHRMIVLGRPGYTAKALAGARRAGVDLDAGHLVMGPELPDISSSAAREALARGDRARAAALLHPAVLEWCEEHGPWRAGTTSARGGSSVLTH